MEPVEACTTESHVALGQQPGQCLSFVLPAGGCTTAPSRPCVATVTWFEFPAWPSAQLCKGKKSVTLVLIKLKSLEPGSLKKECDQEVPTFRNIR